MPGMELSDHEQPGERVQIPSHRRFTHAERARGLGGVPYVAVVMRQHIPESK